MRPNSSSCLPSANWRSSSVSLAHFCFSLPLVIFQLPLISSLFVRVRFVFRRCRRQRDGQVLLRVLAVGLSSKSTTKAGPVLWGITLPSILRGAARRLVHQRLQLVIRRPGIDG